MAKLPDNFVKPPPASSQLTTGRPSAAKLTRRPRKPTELAIAPELDAPGGPDPRDTGSAGATALITADDARGVLVRLSVDEQRALGAACEALAAIGHSVTVEDMIKQVILRWIAATRAMQASALPPSIEPQAPLSLPAPASAMPPAPGAPAAPRPALAMAPIRAQLRKLAAEPLRRWQELSKTLRRWSWVFESRTR